MHRGVPAGTSAPPPPPPQPEPPRAEEAGWPVQSGLMPAAADGFTSRLETAPSLGAALRPGTTVALVPARPADSGSRDWLASCGKTQLAASFAESLWQSRELDLMVWISATSRASVLSGYLAAADETMGGGLPGDAEAVASRFLGWLAETKRPWLVVLDGLADRADLDGLWPAGEAGRVLVTTGDPAVLTGQPGTQLLPVGVFSPREALSYLMGRLTADPDQRIGAIDLVKDLGCEPLALAQASAVIASSSLSCRDYRDYFVRRRDQLTDAAGAEPSAAAVTWTFSVEQADRLSPDGTAQSVLAVAALLDGLGTPAAVFTTAAARGYVAGGPGQPPADPERVRTGLRVMERAGLLALDMAGTQPVVRMSVPVQAAVRAAMPDAMLDRTVRAAADALLEAWPAGDQREWLPGELRSSTANLQRVAGDLLWAGGCHPLLLRAGQSLDSAQLTGPAVDYWRDLATVSDRVLGSGHADTLVAGEHLAAAYLTAARSAEAVPWCQWILAKRVHGLGPDHPSTIAARLELGHALAAAGQIGDAITVLDTAADDYQRVCGPDHLDTLATQDELADAYRSAGQFDDAILIGRRTLASRERIQGAQHPDTTRTRQHLADAYMVADRVKEAIAQYKKVLADTERALGSDSLDTIAARANLAAAYHAAGRMASALQLFEQARTGYERALGADHPETLARSASLAHAYYGAGRLTDATTLLRDTYARCERNLPPGDPLRQAVRDSLTNIVGSLSEH
ncbi:MAG: tetratricopeptide repeat protein [Streptosporangiaceae bacterium]